MSDSIIDLSNINSWDLMKELKSRGYFTDLIFGTQDVDTNLAMINDNRDETEPEILLTEEDKMDILDSCFSVEWYAEQMNDDIYEQILKYK